MLCLSFGLNIIFHDDQLMLFPPCAILFRMLLFYPIEQRNFYQEPGERVSSTILHQPARFGKVVLLTAISA